MSNKIGIIDYGLCNLLNVKNAIKYLGANAEIIDTPESIENQSHIILPGVGAFKNGMRGLIIRNLVDSIKNHVLDDKPFLGICLGMQMMLNKSYEYVEIEGLNLVDGEVIKIPNRNSANKKHKIPHIGCLLYTSPSPRD